MITYVTQMIVPSFNKARVFAMARSRYADFYRADSRVRLQRVVGEGSCMAGFEVYQINRPDKAGRKNRFI